MVLDGFQLPIRRWARVASSCPVAVASALTDLPIGAGDVVVGETATLELDPRQVEIVLLAQRVGQLSLALRSLQDISKVDGPIEKGNDNSLTIVRYGAAPPQLRRLWIRWKMRSRTPRTAATWCAR